MAYRVERKYEAEQGRKRAIGLTLPFSSTSVFKSTYQTTDTCKADILTYFLTGKGERPLNPEFGNNFISKFLFEPLELGLSQKQRIEQEIRQDMSIYFPKVVVDNISIEQNASNNTTQISVEYHIKDSNLKDEVSVNIG